MVQIPGFSTDPVLASVLIFTLPLGELTLVGLLLGLVKLVMNLIFLKVGGSS